MNRSNVNRFETYLASVDEQALDVRIYSNSLNFHGYKSEFIQWVNKVVDDICQHTPNSRAFITAKWAKEDIQSELDSRFDSGIRNLKDALANAIEYHSLLQVESLPDFQKACSQINSDAEAMLSDFCRQFCSVVDSGGGEGASVTVRIRTLRHKEK